MAAKLLKKLDWDTIGVIAPCETRYKVALDGALVAIKTISPLSFICGGPNPLGGCPGALRIGELLSITVCNTRPVYKKTPQPKFVAAALDAKFDTNTTSPLLLMCGEPKPPPKKRFERSGI